MREFFLRFERAVDRPGMDALLIFFWAMIVTVFVCLAIDA